jgi:peptide/nickel transport system permease protein
VRNLVVRIASALVLLWLVISLTFVLVRVAPGDPTDLLVGPAASAADIARARVELGLDDPLALQYARWIAGIVSGDMGESIAFRRPVIAVLGDALPLSLLLGGLSLALTFAIGVLVGTVQASRRGRTLDTVLTIITTSVYAAPSFWLALSLVAVFTYGASRLGFPAALRLPAFGVSDPAGQYTGLAALVDVARHLVLPTTVLTAIGAAGIARYARSAIADVLGADHVRTARAKGAGVRRIYGRHVLSNALPPLVVLMALSLPGVIAGSVFVETVFALPGMGRAMLSAIASRDYPVILGATIVYAALVIGANLAADLIMPMLDPRRRAA